MRTTIRHTWLGSASILTLLCLALPAACKDDTTLPTTGQALPDGELQLTIITTGSDPDIDGYSVIVDHAVVTQVTPNKEYSLTLAPGDHLVELGGIAPNCQLNTPNPRTIKIVAGGHAGATFQLTCPHFSALQVVTTTTGPNHDTDGYQLMLDGEFKETLMLSGTTTIPLILPGTHLLRLASVPVNCSVDGGSTRAIFVPDGELATISFGVTCSIRPDDTPGEKLVTARQDPQASFSSLVIMETDGSNSLQLVDDPDGTASPEFSRDGNRILFLKFINQVSRLTILDRATREETVLPLQFVDRGVWTPDGTGIVYVQSGRLYRINADGTAQIQLTSGSDDRDPYVSPDGTRIVFTRGANVFMMNENGSGLHQVGPSNRTAGPWSPDGRTLVLNKLEVNTNTCYYYWYYYPCYPTPSDLVLLDVQSGAETPLTDTPLIGEWSPAWSTDGQSVYFISNSGSNADIFRIPRNGAPAVNITNSAANENWITVGFVQGESLRGVSRVRRP